MSVKATVRGGRLLVDEPTDLPDGTVLEFVIDDGGDNHDTHEHKAIRSAISKSLEQASQGRISPADDILETLRTR